VPRVKRWLFECVGAATRRTAYLRQLPICAHAKAGSLGQGCRPPECEEPLVRPASKNLHNNGHTRKYERTGFQGGLQGYRRTGPRFIADLQTFGGRTIDVPSLFISGKSDWGVFQTPGAFEAMQNTACTQMLGAYLIDGAGHWVEQEQPEQVSKLLIQFLQDASTLNSKL
jgi:pimeloyl-ACP methyl ester carboxylesterase